MNATADFNCFEPYPSVDRRGRDNPDSRLRDGAT
jgi:hypothetical protein